MSRGSGFSTASAVEFRKSANCRGSPIARNYHSKINRSKEAKRIDEENLVSSISSGSAQISTHQSQLVLVPSGARTKRFVDPWVKVIENHKKVRLKIFIRYLTIFRLCYEGYKT